MVLNLKSLGFLIFELDLHSENHYAFFSFLLQLTGLFRRFSISSFIYKDRSFKFPRWRLKLYQYVCLGSSRTSISNRTDPRIDFRVAKRYSHQMCHQSFPLIEDAFILFDGTKPYQVCSLMAGAQTRKVSTNHSKKPTEQSKQLINL